MTRITRLAEAASRSVHGEEGAAEEGFTLIELLVVLLIIGILLAIAIPTFLSVTKSANNTAAQSNLQTALTGAKTFYTEGNQSYSGLCPNGTCGAGSATVSATGLAAIDTGVSYVQTASTSPHTVSVNVDASDTLVVMVAHASGTNDCWGIADNTAASNTNWAPDTTTYFVKKNVASGACIATGFAASSSAGQISTNGFGALSG